MAVDVVADVVGLLLDVGRATVAEFSTTVCTRALNQLSTPRVTSTPKNRATITAGATAARANRRDEAQVQPRAGVALARPNRRSTRQPRTPRASRAARSRAPSASAPADWPARAGPSGGRSAERDRSGGQQRGEGVADAHHHGRAERDAPTRPLCALHHDWTKVIALVWPARRAKTSTGMWLFSLNRPAKPWRRTRLGARSLQQREAGWLRTPKPGRCQGSCRDERSAAQVACALEPCGEEPSPFPWPRPCA